MPSGLDSKLLRVRVSVATLCVLAASAGYGQGAPSSAEELFNEQMKPVITEHCNGCHTFGGHSGGLRMDSYATLMQGGDDGPVIIPGDADSSMLMNAIRYKDENLQMPPKGQLSDADAAIVAKWIKAIGQVSPAGTSPTVSPSAPLTPAHSSTPSEATPAMVKAADAAIRPVSTQVAFEQNQFFEMKVRPILIKNCYGCHAGSARGGLELTSRDKMLKGGKDGVVAIPGHPESSLLVSAIRYTDDKLMMPPGGPMKKEDVAVIEQWLRDGAPWPKMVTASDRSHITAADRNFWSFHAPVRPMVPVVQGNWAYNDIDRFILAKLEQKHLRPVRDADKRTLIRRVTYDVTGLPPTPMEVNAFLADKSPQAYERLVDRLLASPAYGERWGRMWLDVVRYADTSGGGGDYPVKQAYKYRDYIITSFNQDKPYDRFIREQIAGDLLPYKTEPEHWQNIVATGYVAGAVRADEAWTSDAVDNLGSAYLGLTVGCARCHDHKFDPIPTSDYYALKGIFDSTHFPDPGSDNSRMQTGFVVRDEARAESQQYTVFRAQLKPIVDAINAVQRLPGTYDDLMPQLQARRMNLLAHAPPELESAYAVSDGRPQNALIFKHGDPTDLGDEVPRGFLQVLGGGPLPANTKGSGRLELANWIASKDNPLTARVIVNRLWQGHFGRGIVVTANDFGTRGIPPSNQALLDYLAWQLMDNGWSLKTIQREILLSHAYRLSTAGSADNEAIDPDDDFVWRHRQQRLDAEEIRDSLLADSGTLDRSPGGPHPFPPQSQWNWEEQNPFAPNLSKYENNHRTVYMMVQRSVRHPYLTLFDGADPGASTELRSSSLTPLQALYFMNGDFPRKCADVLTPKLFTEEASQETAIRRAFLLIYARPVSAPELKESMEFLRKAAAVYTAHGASATAAQAKSEEGFLQAMFSSNEFMFIE
ncbi:MAG TPA: PSD1 and planctomycete cytochrome C domain-containing protein [Terracidiphilus sp.]|nr:PSD1 and planctomycete cytochrome C domain-containing protein [Terracidiphilus sp.]